MLATEPLVIDVVQDVDIVYQDGLVVAEQSLRLLQSPTRLQQLGGLVADEDFLFTFVDMVDDLLGEVVNVDNKAVVTGLLQLVYLDVQQRLAAYGHQRLRHCVRKGFQSGAEACGEYHCLLHGN